MFNTKKRKKKDSWGNFLTLENLSWSGTKPQYHYQWPLHMWMISLGLCCVLCSLPHHSWFAPPANAVPSLLPLAKLLLTFSSLKCPPRLMDMQVAFSRSVKQVEAFQVSSFPRRSRIHAENLTVLWPILEAKSSSRLWVVYLTDCGLHWASRKSQTASHLHCGLLEGKTWSHSLNNTYSIKKWFWGTDSLLEDPSPPHPHQSPSLL